MLPSSLFTTQNVISYKFFNVSFGTHDVHLKDLLLSPLAMPLVVNSTNKKDGTNNNDNQTKQTNQI